MLTQPLIKEYILPALALIWAAVFLGMAFLHQGEIINLVSFYLRFFTIVYVAGNTMTKAIQRHDQGVLLSAALGFSCLALGFAYFLLLMFASVSHTITVGNFAMALTYLFFLAVLMELKGRNSQENKLFFAVVNMVAIAATITCAYAVIANNDLMFQAAVIMLDILCLIMAITLLPNKEARFFAIMIIVVMINDIVINIFPHQVLLLLIEALVPFMYLMLFRSVIILKGEGQQYAG